MSRGSVAPLLFQALLIVGCAKPWLQVEPVQVSPLEPTAEEWRVTDHVVVITDASGTMAMEGRLPEARAFAQSFLAGIPDAGVRAKNSPTYEVSFIGFGGSDRLATSHDRVDAPRHRRNVSGTAAYLRPLGTPPMGGSTPIADVLTEAGESLEGKRGQAAVVLISDGVADDPAAALEAGRGLVAQHADGLCIHTVQTGDDPDGKALLGELANLSTDGCGSARSAAGLRNEASLRDLQRNVFFGAAPLPPVAAAPDSCSQRIVLRGVQFAFDSAELQTDSGPVLDVAVEQLRECAESTLSIEGHTCSIGTDEYNQDLSTRRAASVRQYLVDHGIDASRLMARGLGETGPVASNDSEDGRAQNRRVELVPPAVK